MKFNRSQIAEAFGVELTSVDKWRRSGCPSTKNGKSVEFTVRQVSDWLRTRDMESSGVLDLSQERAKLTKLQAEKATLELEQQCGTLLPLEMVIVAWQGQIANAKARLLALPPKVASQVLGMESYVEVEHVIKDIIYEALDELAGDDVPKEYEQRLEAIVLTYSDTAYGTSRSLIEAQRVVYAKCEGLTTLSSK